MYGLNTSCGPEDGQTTTQNVEKSQKEYSPDKQFLMEKIKTTKEQLNYLQNRLKYEKDYLSKEYAASREQMVNNLIVNVIVNSKMKIITK